MHTYSWVHDFSALCRILEFPCTLGMFAAFFLELLMVWAIHDHTLSHDNHDIRSINFTASGLSSDPFPRTPNSPDLFIYTNKPVLAI